MNSTDILQEIPAKTFVIIPAFNEALSIDKVIAEIPKGAAEIVVVNNNSSDRTALVAAENGATVLDEPKQGYGFACLKGLEYIRKKEPDIVVFLDADYSDFPEEMPQLIAPIALGNFDMVIGSRALGERERGSMTPQQIFGNWLATNLIQLFFKVKYTDLGPFRAIRYSSLLQLQMEDQTYGWTVEMQLKAAKYGLNVTEVPVSYKKRIGKSKVSGTIKGTVLAGYKILSWIFKYALK
ncbi:glycosyltransferase family 2 protein [Marinilongibacter aquaticus]|uniref:glycosyltransferase family 2 protein n=1 Tax=Marinilongibacter aquaticus TaxID=2975157 RepID=UPI0021BD8CB7|nr:glycosyltransferase family 2 protein [Marinilongibacter aquaticus]UBM57681.1 glycosyltransferase family 2 protein [Marinilongibacter aquaticus]